jgi:uncharacterized protein YbjT (DUF2867 family)
MVLRPLSKGKAYQAIGREELRVGEQVRMLADAIGKPIEYFPITGEVAR